MNVDFQQNRTTVAPSFSGSGGAAWDTATWDVASWAAPNTLVRKWQAVSSIGTSGGLRVVTMTSTIGCKWQSSDIVFEVGGIL